MLGDGRGDMTGDGLGNMLGDGRGDMTGDGLGNMLGEGYGYGFGDKEDLKFWMKPQSYPHGPND
jgi:hypothetical protein